MCQMYNEYDIDQGGTLDLQEVEALTLDLGATLHRILSSPFNYDPLRRNLRNLRNLLAMQV